jgi:isoaspartyl peptidase/L-asparaginase-like protein (Ntn-hydrolase superfamily)
VRFLGESIEVAANACLEELKEKGGTGGAIVLDENGNCEYSD